MNPPKNAQRKRPGSKAGGETGLTTPKAKRTKRLDTAKRRVLAGFENLRNRISKGLSELVEIVDAEGNVSPFEVNFYGAGVAMAGIASARIEKYLSMFSSAGHRSYRAKHDSGTDTWTIEVEDRDIPLDELMYGIRTEAGHIMILASVEQAQREGVTVRFKTKKHQKIDVKTEKGEQIILKHVGLHRYRKFLKRPN